jgi:BirA family biotin operon repressor/biotin-[acetyl-CoA-carboxylase] ligase
MLDIEKIKRTLNTERIGRQIYFYEEVLSTNLLGHQMARNGWREGTLFVAEYQTAGKGRLGRNWQAAKGENLLMSIILRPKMRASEMYLITFLTSIVIIKAIQSHLKQIDVPCPDLKVKWPNDIMVEGKKIAGILSESKCNGKMVEYMIIGIGINVNQIFNSRKNELRRTATSLRTVCSQEIIREMLLQTLLKEFDRSYLRAISQNYIKVIGEWKKFWDGRYMRVTIDNGRVSRTGIVEDIGQDGKLVLKTEEGSVRSIASGEIISWN